MGPHQLTSQELLSRPAAAAPLRPAPELQLRRHGSVLQLLTELPGRVDFRHQPGGKYGQSYFSQGGKHRQGWLNAQVLAKLLHLRPTRLFVNAANRPTLSQKAVLKPPLQQKNVFEESFFTSHAHKLFVQPCHYFYTTISS